MSTLSGLMSPKFACLVASSMLRAPCSTISSVADDWSRLCTASSSLPTMYSACSDHTRFKPHADYECKRDSSKSRLQKKTQFWELYFRQSRISKIIPMVNKFQCPDNRSWVLMVVIKLAKGRSADLILVYRQPWESGNWHQTSVFMGVLTTTDWPTVPAAGSRWVLGIEIPWPSNKILKN